MAAKRIVPNIASDQLEKAKSFYAEILDMEVVMNCVRSTATAPKTACPAGSHKHAQPAPAASHARTRPNVIRAADRETLLRT